MPRLLLRISVFVLFAWPSVSFAAPVFNNDAASIGDSRFSVRAAASVGMDYLLSDDLALGIRGGLDYGASKHLQIGAWFGYGNGGTTCAKGGGGCFDNRFLAGGARLRFGLRRSANDRWQLGLEWAGSTIRKLSTRSVFDLRSELALLGSVRVNPVGLAYVRLAGGVLAHSTSFERTEVTPVATVGFEFLPTSIHPYLEGSLGFPFRVSEGDLEEPIVAVLAGATVNWGG